MMQLVDITGKLYGNKPDRSFEHVHNNRGPIPEWLKSWQKAQEGEDRTDREKAYGCAMEVGTHGKLLLSLTYWDYLQYMGMASPMGRRP